jgi:hypothetical protein
VALRTNYKIKIAQHKHTIHSNIIKQYNNQKSLYGTKVWNEVWLARYGLIDWKGHVLRKKHDYASQMLRRKRLTRTYGQGLFATPV